MKAHAKPTRYPVTTCERVCCLRITRLVPTSPASKRMRQIHQVGLKLKISAKAMTAPVTPPMAAEWVEIFHQRLMMAQVSCIISEATTMLPTKCGVWK